MFQPNYLPIDHLLEEIDQPNREACLRLLADNRILFQTVQGSTHNHQNWPGGYFDHVQEILNIAAHLYPVLNNLRPLPFSLSSVLLVLFLHDIEKPWKYEFAEDGELRHKPAFAKKSDDHSFRMAKLSEYGITFTDQELNAFTYVEGELNDYSSRRRVMNELAAFCHIADVTSARIWYAHPRTEDDPWNGADRVRDAFQLPLFT